MTTSGERLLGRDRIRRQGDRVVLWSPADMDDWQVREYRRTAILFEGERYFVAAREPDGAGVRYTLRRWPEELSDIPGRVVEYDDSFVAVRDARRGAEWRARRLRLVLLPFYPVIGLLPSGFKARLADRYGVSEELSTALSMCLELALAMWIVTFFTLRAFGGAFGAGADIELSQIVLGRKGLDVPLLLTMVIDLVVRYSRILAEDRRCWGFWEWLFRRD